MIKYIRKQNIETTQLDGEWLILDSLEYTITTLNGVGGYCWELLREEQTICSIIQSLKEQYLLKEELIQQDIESFLSELIKCGLVKDAS